MTAHNGRGQGDEPLYEGVVLPANGDPWTPEQQRQVAQSQSQPPAGQPWGQPWGPESQAVAQSTWDSAGPPPQAPPVPLAAPPAQPPAQPPAPPPVQPLAAPPEQQPLPGSTGATYGNMYGGGQPLPQAAPAPGPGSAPAPAPYDAQPPYGGAHLPPSQAGALPAPMQSFAGEADATQMLPPQQGAPAQAYAGAQGYAGQQAVPGYASASDATQYIQPVPGALQYGQPQHGADATQMLPPQAGRLQSQDAAAMPRTPLPPESNGATAASAPYGMSQGDPGPGPGSGPGPADGPQHRQPPAEFDSLFRTEAPPAAPDRSQEPGSTQSLPLFDQAAAHQWPGGNGGPAGAGAPGYGQGGQGGPYGQQSYEYEPQGRAARRSAERGGRGGGSRMSPGVMIAIGVVLVAGVGLAAGAALSGGGEGHSGGGASADPAAGKGAAGSDAVETQAKQLDRLLDDSNNSRTAVIRSVENIKSCQNLGQAATDLRSAAGQRNGLVTRLGQLETGKLPSSAQLTSALTRAWKSSAAADSHYAAWADQTAKKKGCHKGRARNTAQTGVGTRSSGEATTAKKEAAGLWNPTAQKYGLKTRQFGQL